MKLIRFISLTICLLQPIGAWPETIARPPAATMRGAPDTAAFITGRIAFYNVENLFDPTRDSTISDQDYTPTGSRHWGRAKYETKCNRIFKVIAALDAEYPLLCIGLAEVENARVLRQLCLGTPLRYDGYGFVHFDSPDRRGIDVALLYRTDRLEILAARPLPVGRDIGADAFHTRDILSVQARVRATGDMLHLFVVHFPSKFGGALVTDGRRRQAGMVLRQAMDSVRIRHPNALVLAMGDFNATADETALSESIGFVPASALRPSEAAAHPADAPYIHLMADFPPEVGSHKYRERWSLIDHILVSPALWPLCRPQSQACGRWRLPKSKTLYAAVFYRDFLLTADPTYFGEKPFRTFVGPMYHGGYSDHLPVYVDVQFRPAAP